MAAQGQLRDLCNDQRLRRFLLPNVRPTGRELGTGAYGSVEEVEVSGLVCAGKKIHEALVQAGTPNIAERYVEECQLMSDLRHPHIVQFLGICFLPSSRLPVLLMERLHASMDDLLTQHTRHPPLLATPDIPLSQKRSFLVDIARGLHFLHTHNPRVIHRDLSAKNVLLNTSMTAKISDLGNARIVDFQPGQLALTMSRVPGTPVYMPPEAFDTHSRYGPRLDLFSFGHLALYILIQVFPWDLLPATYPDPQAPKRLFGQRRVIGRSEVERRRPYITQLHQQLGEEHPLTQLVLQCLANEEEERPSAEDVLQRLKEIEIDDPYQNLTRLDMMVMVGEKEEEIQQTVQESQQKDREIQRRDEEIQRKEAEIEEKQQVIQQKEEQIQQMVDIQRRDVDMQRKDHDLQQKNEEIQRLQSQVQRLQAQVRALDAAQQSKAARVVILSNRVDQLESKEEKMQAQHISEVETLSLQVSSLSEDNSNLSSLMKAKTSSLQVKEEQIEGLRRELVVKERQVDDKSKELEAKQREINSLTKQAKAHTRLVHSLQKQLSGIKQQLLADKKSFQEQLTAKEQELFAKGRAFLDQISAKEQELKTSKKSFQDQLSAKEQELFAKGRSFLDQISAKEQELKTSKKPFQDQLSAKEQELSALQLHTEGTAQERDALQLELVSLREGLQTKDAEIAVQRERVRTTEEEVRVKTAEITAKDALLQSKESTVQALWKEVQSPKQREMEQVTLLHPGGASLESKPCADPPVWMVHAQAVQLKTKVYVQGYTDSYATRCTIYTYEVPKDAWVSMKSPAMWSALTIYCSQLALVGGKEATARLVTSQLWVLQDEQTWTQPLPTMPTARYSASAISSGDHLVVTGGHTGRDWTDLVEVYDGEQWVRADPLPMACCDIRSTYHSGMWYLMGGSGQSTSVFYTSLHSLIAKATQQPPHSTDSSEQQSVWKTLPNVPYKYSSTTTLGGALLTLGGRDSKGKSTSAIHVCTPLVNSWLYIGDMPEALDSTCTITLSTGEIMIIGGLTRQSRSSHVYKVGLKQHQ